MKNRKQYSPPPGVAVDQWGSVVPRSEYREAIGLPANPPPKRDEKSEKKA